MAVIITRTLPLQASNRDFLSCRAIDGDSKAGGVIFPLVMSHIFGSAQGIMGTVCSYIFSH